MEARIAKLEYLERDNAVLHERLARVEAMLSDRVPRVAFIQR